MDGKDVGKRAEHIVLTALRRLGGGNMYPQPDWLISVRKGNKEEEPLGGDIIASTSDLGNLMLQVKSSPNVNSRDRERYERNGAKIIIISRELSLAPSLADIVVVRVQIVAIALLEIRREEMLSQVRSEAAA